MSLIIFTCLSKGMGRALDNGSVLPVRRLRFGGIRGGLNNDGMKEPMGFKGMYVCLSVCVCVCVCLLYSANSIV